MAATRAAPFTIVKRSAGGPPPPAGGAPPPGGRPPPPGGGPPAPGGGAPAGRAIGGPSAMTTKPCDAISLKYSGNVSPFFAQPPSPQTSTPCLSSERSRGR